MICHSFMKFIKIIGKQFIKLYNLMISHNLMIFYSFYPDQQHDIKTLKQSTTSS